MILSLELLCKDSNDRARLWLQFLERVPFDELETVAWVVADPTHREFGSVIDNHLMNNAATALTFSSRGVVLQDGEEIFVERVGLKDLETWKNEKGRELGDVRLLGDHKDNAGKRRLDLSAAVALMHDAKDDEFPVAGVRAARELHDSIATGPGNFLSYHAEWIRLSGVSQRNAAAHVHRNICEILRLLHSYDQVDCSSLAGGETLLQMADPDRDGRGKVSFSTRLSRVGHCGWHSHSS